jgi:hypothetical protein
MTGISLASHNRLKVDGLIPIRVAASLEDIQRSNSFFVIVHFSLKLLTHSK